MTLSRTDRRYRQHKKTPRLTFWLGGFVTATFGLTCLSIALRILARGAHVGDPAMPLETLLATAAIFAGVPALLTGGGVARLVAHRAEEHGGAGSPSLTRAMLTGAGAMAIGGTGLAFLVAVPLGGMPERPLAWLPLAGAGAAAGIVTGLALGVLVGQRQRRHHQKRQEAP